MVVQFLRVLNIEKPEAEIAQGYIERFVEPFLRGRTADQTLSQLFRTQRSDLEQGISAFLTRLRPALYSSDHWRDPIRDQALEEVRSTVLDIKRHLAPIAATDVSSGSCLGMLSPSRRYGPVRLEATCQRALALGTLCYSHVRDFLDINRDKITIQAEPLWTSSAQRGSCKPLLTCQSSLMSFFLITLAQRSPSARM